MKTIEAADGEVLVIERQRNWDITVKGNPKRIILNDCQHISLRGLYIRQTDNNPIDKKRGLIEVINSGNIIIADNNIEGNIGDHPHLNDDEYRKHWIANVPNGIIIGEDCKEITVKDNVIERCHIGVQARGEHTTITGNDIQQISGDHIQYLHDNTTIIDNELSWSVAILPYVKFHRDYIQGWSANSKPLKNITIMDNVIFNYAWQRVRLSAPAQVIIFSDGTGDNFVIRNNKVFTAHPMLCLLNPVSNSCITDNEFRIVGDLKDKPILAIADRKGYGIKPKNNIIENNIITTDASQKETPMSDEELPTICQFTEQVESLANKNATAVTEQDYAEAADRLRLKVTTVKAVAKVESRGFGFNSDGSVKSLYERHIAYRELKKKKRSTRQAQKLVGDNIINRRTGGYKGDIAEYRRAKECSRLPFGDALDIALRSCSWGEFQIMGFNHELAGYDTPLQMVEAFHESEKAHLDAFCNFLEQTGLVVHLRSAEEQIHAGNWKEALKHLNKFACGYNGKAHKNYHIKIMNEIKRLEDLPEPELKPLQRSRTMAAGAGSAGTGVVSLGTGAGIFTMLDDAREQKEALIQEVETLKDDVAALKAEAAQIDPLVWVLLAFMLVMNAGTIISGVATLWARVTDRWEGKN